MIYRELGCDTNDSTVKYRQLEKSEIVKIIQKCSDNSGDML